MRTSTKSVIASKLRLRSFGRVTSWNSYRFSVHVANAIHLSQSSGTPCKRVISLVWLILLGALQLKFKLRRHVKLEKPFHLGDKRSWQWSSGSNYNHQCFVL